MVSLAVLLICRKYIHRVYFSYLINYIFGVNKIFNRHCLKTIGNGFDDVDLITVSNRKVNRMAAVLNTIIDFCGNVCINKVGINKVTTSNIF